MRRIHLLAIPPVLIVALLVGEFVYRARAAAAFDRLIERVDAAHPEYPAIVGDIRRYGRPVDRFQVCLVEDLWEAWLLRAGEPLDRNSRLRLDLNLPGDDTALTSAYASVWIDRPSHVFIWSPRKMEFILWEYDMGCSHADCPAFTPPSLIAGE